MRVCKIWDADYPWDVRVEKVTATLVGSGWNVDLICRNEKRRSRRETHGLLTIHRLPCVAKSLGIVNRFINFPYFFNPFWISTILQVGRLNRPDVILVRDLPLAVTGIVAGRMLGSPVVLDLAENYPAMMRDIWRFGRFRLTNVFVRNPWFAQWIERYALARVDHIIVVVEESASRLVRLGVDAAKITVVSNTPVQSRLDTESCPRPHDMPDGDPILMYLGNLDPGRGIDMLIRTMPAVRRVAPDARLVIVGSGSQFATIRSYVVDHGLQDAVIFVGRITHALTWEYLRYADICVIPHESTDSNNTTISNKLFDYMATGKAIVVSDCPPTARIVRSVGCGLVFHAGDSEALTDAICRLLDPNIRRELGRKGREAVQTRYNWENDSRELVKALLQASGRTVNPSVTRSSTASPSLV